MSLSDKLKSFLHQKEKNNMEAGEAFLAENGKREVVVTLPSGLQYEIIILKQVLTISLHLQYSFLFFLHNLPIDPA